MATPTKNKLIERYQTLKGTKALEAIEPLITQSGAFIAKKNGVPVEDVTGILIEKILDSGKKFPYPAIEVVLETSKKDVYNYVEFLWEYYDCPVIKTKPQRKKVVAKTTKLPKINNKKTQNAKPEVQIDASSQLIKKGDPLTITWKSENADLVVDTDNFKVKDKTQVSGTVTIKNITKSTTFEITVSNDAGTATDSIDVEIEEDDYFKNLTDDIKKELEQKENDKQQVISKFPSKSFNKITDSLPLNLKKDKRVYKGMALDFELDFDLACYVLVDSKEINSTDLPYLEWAKNVSGQEQDVLLAHGKKVRKFVRELGKAVTGLRFLHVPAVQTDFKVKKPQEPSMVDGKINPKIQFVAPTIGDKLANKSKKVNEIKEENNPIIKALLDIKKTTQDIVANLTGQKKDSKKSDAQLKREKERRRRLAKEALLEKPAQFLMKATEKMLAPVKSILDRIINFIVFTILGRALYKFYKWVNDPKNKDKVDVIVRFLKDWWPVLLGAFVLFGTGFGKMIRSSIGLIVKITKSILGKGIPSLIRFLSGLGPRGKAIAAIVAAGAATYAATQLMPQDNNEPPKKPTEPPKKDPKPTTPGATASNIYPSPVRAARGGGLITQLRRHSGLSFAFPDETNVNQIAFAEGGQITEDTGLKITGAGKDTQLLAAQPGEVVISKSAVDHFGGPDFFLKLNALGGGTNQPKFANNIQMAAGGGLVGKPGPSSSNYAPAQKMGQPNQKPSAKLTTAFNMPAVNLATTKLKKDEALSSLTKGRNDFIKPGQKSVVTNTPWSALKDSTPIHAYLDSENVPTIGWGATFYDSLFKGNKSVKMGDTITKKQADKVFHSQVLDLANNYSTQIKYWPMMTDNQRAGLLMTGFNAPNGPIGAYRKLTGALNAGDTTTAAKELQRGGPNKERIKTEQDLLMSGPKNLKTAPNRLLEFTKKQEKPVVKPANNGGIFQTIQTQFNKIFNVNDDSSRLQSANPRTPQITPGRPAARTSFVDLPTITLGSNNIPIAPQKSTSLPEFSAISFAYEERMNNATSYGIG